MYNPHWQAHWSRHLLDENDSQIMYQYLVPSPLLPSLCGKNCYDWRKKNQIKKRARRPNYDRHIDPDSIVCSELPKHFMSPAPLPIIPIITSSWDTTPSCVEKKST